ncbi:ATP-binding protein [Sphingomonas sanguinis]|uniref:ATP-binding protein n=1 Tax=Sphingomonas sanguinis TaxID=33051 RepID=UPI001C57E328|nr:ATP-binding protein [Sphingomonas sanguinis]QXT34878.1 ATP-binding protein [Sphingomonas sanguinis]
MTAVELPLGGPALELLGDVTARAALRGPFDPLELVGDLGDPRVVDVLGALSADCVEVVGDDAVKWELTADARQRALSSMAMGPLGLSAVAERIEPVDAFSRYLRKALRGDLNPSIGRLEAEALEAARKAMQFAAPFLDRARAAWEVDSVLAVRTAEAERAILSSGPLIGRDWHLRNLRTLARSALEDVDQSAIAWAAVVTGEPGVGKSALLAEFSRLHRSYFGPGFPLLWFDFDRAALSTPTPQVLLEELARQIGFAVPYARWAVDAFLDQPGVDDERSDGLLESQSLEAAREAVLWSRWRATVGQALDDVPLLLVFDTLEEVLVHRDGRAEQLAAWLRALFGESGMRRVRMVLAGRTDEGQLSALLGAGSRNLPLAELKPAPAARLLRDLLWSARVETASIPVDALVERYGGNPLTLKMIARYVAAEGADGAGELLVDVGERRFASVIAQTVLYTRILRRIRTSDPDLEKVAYPGLVLRRVTPDLIRHVLAGPCGLGDVDEARASALFGALSEQVWLVDTRREPGAVRHRRELRRQMFQAMMAGQPALSLDIHRAASAYYEAGGDRALTAREQRAEGIYHRAFVQPDAFGEADLAELRTMIGEDVADLPAELRARIKFMSDRGLEVDEFAALAPDLQREVAVESASRSLRRGVDPAGGAATGLASRPVALRPADPVPSLAAEKAYGAGDLDTLVALGTRLVQEFVDEFLLDRRRSRSRMPDDFTSFGVWRAAMAASGRREAGWMLDALREHASSPHVEWAAAMNPHSKEYFSRSEAVDALFRLLGDEDSRMSIFQPRQTRSRPEVRTTQALRHVQLGAGSVGPSYMRVGLRLLRYLDPAMVDGVERLRDQSLAVFASPDLVETLERLRQLGRGRAPTLAEYALRDGQRLGLDVRIAAFRDPVTSGLLRGMTPELHQLVLVCAREAGREALLSFAAQAEAAPVLWPEELRPDRLSRSFSSGFERWAGTMIEAADRAAMLPELLAGLAEHGNAPERARRVMHVLDAYDRVLLGKRGTR